MKPLLLPKIHVLLMPLRPLKNFTPWCVKSELHDKIYIFVPVFDKGKFFFLGKK